MNSRFFYLVGVGVCAGLLFLLLVVNRNTQQDPQSGFSDQVLTQNLEGGKTFIDQKRKNNPNRLSPPPQSRGQPEDPNMAFQRLADLLNQLGITTNDIFIDLKHWTVNWGPHSNWNEYYGNPPTHTYRIEPVIQKQHLVLKAPPQLINGCYRTNWGTMRLYVKGDVVIGTFKYFGINHLIGKLKDNIMVGIWVRSARNNRPIRSGAFQFAFTENWSSFKGVWRYKGKVPLFRNWSGKKIQCPSAFERPTQKPIPGGPGVPGRVKRSPGPRGSQEREDQGE